MAELSVLDVGHGNCAVLEDGQGTVVIDAAERDTLLEFLEQRRITAVDTILISHADADHVAGLIGLLGQRHLTIKSVHLNSEPLRRSSLWTALRVALADARRRRAVEVIPHLSTSSTGALRRQAEVQVEVLAPAPELALGGAGGRDLDDRRLSANAMSAVVRVVSDSGAEALLAGDLDDIGLDNLLADHPAPRARVLVFPHHGGRPGRADPYRFAKRLCEAVQPEVVVFSIGRGRHATPQPEIVRGVLAAAPSVHIACTQLSEWCAAALPGSSPGHLSDSPARGRPANACCAGTLRFMLGAAAPTYAPARSNHVAFVARDAPTALCLWRGVLDSRAPAKAGEGG